METDNTQAIVKSNRDIMLKDLKDSYESIFDKLTIPEQETLTKYYGKKKYGFLDSIAMICRGDNCPVRSTCPLFQVSKHPLNESCPIEIDLLHFHIERYAEELNLDPRVHSELIMLTELAECLIYEDRATKTLRESDASMLILETEKFTPTGDVWIDKQIHPALVIKDKMKARRNKILEALAATRKDKVKMIKEVNKTLDYASVLSDYKKRVDKLKVQA